METAQTGERGRSAADGTVNPKNGNVRLLVKCFFDEGSDTTYINKDLVEELGVRRQKEPVIVNVTNDQRVKFLSMSFQVGLESIDGEMNRVISAKTSQKICGGMKPINWLNIKHKWSHLRDIPSHSFPKDEQFISFLEQTITN